MTPDNLSQLLKHIRKSHGISQRRLAECLVKASPRTKASQRTISRWEVGECLESQAMYWTALECAGAKITVKDGDVVVRFSGGIKPCHCREKGDSPPEALEGYTADDHSSHPEVPTEYR